MTDNANRRGEFFFSDKASEEVVIKKVRALLEAVQARTKAEVERQRDESLNKTIGQRK